ncbi:MAG TPA: hypothetical protein VMX55_04430 [candidate division Zixibacteria bacterium]|nr:hypothetical protein [candidate division Zixibacteria bacterium]
MQKGLKHISIIFVFVVILLAPMGYFFNYGIVINKDRKLASNWDFIDNEIKIDKNSILTDKVLEKPQESGFTQKTYKQYFCKNNGQFIESFAFYTHGDSFSLGFSDSQIVYFTDSSSFKITFLNSNRIIPYGEKLLSGVSNFYLGSKSIMSVEHYAQITYENLYEGISLRFYFCDDGLKYDFIVEPYSNIDKITMYYEGLDNLIVKEKSLLLNLDKFIIQDKNLKVWYANSQKELDFSFILNEEQKLFDNGYTVKFSTNIDYDHSQEIIIDPLVCIFSTFYGGSDCENPVGGANVISNGLVLDSDGNIIIAGRSKSLDYPTFSAYQSTYCNGYDTVITKLTPDGQSIIFSTFLGGSGDDWLESLELDSEGNIAVIGTTDSDNFPVVNAIDDEYSGGNIDEPSDMFLAKFSENGSILFSTYWGGSGNDGGSDICFDTYGNLIIIGSSTSSDYYTLNAHQSSKGGNADIVVTKFASDGQSVLYSTFYGGSDSESVRTCDIDSNNDIVLVGNTQYNDFPTYNAYQTGIKGVSGTVFLKFSSSGVLQFASTFDGIGFDSSSTVIIDSEDNFIIGGCTDSSDFPLVNAIQSTHSGGLEAFISKFSADGQTLLYSTIFGGSGGDECKFITINDEGDYLIAGHTTSTDFPVIHGFQDTYSGGYDVFLSMISENNILISSGYIGGNKHDQATGIAFDEQNNIIVTGFTLSSDFPTNNAYQSALSGTNDLFLAKFTLDLTPPDEEISPTKSNGLGLLPILTILSFLSLLEAIEIKRKK